MNIKNAQIGIRLLLTILVMSLFSWVIVHVMAVMGIFLAVGYLIWIFFSANSEKGFKPGLFSRRNSREVQTHSVWYPYLAVAGNFVALLAFTAISYGVVRAEMAALATVAEQPRQAEVVFDIPEKGRYQVGEIIPVPIRISGATQPVNLVQADIAFDHEKVEVTDVSTDGSFANIFVQREIDNATGYVRLTGGLANPGFSGEHGLFATVYFRAKGTGVTQVEFLPTSLALINDGKGSNGLTTYGAIPMVILPSEVAKITPRPKEVTMNSIEQNTAGEERQLLYFDEAPTVTPMVTVVPIPVSAPNIARAPKVSFTLPLQVIRRIDRVIVGLWSRTGLALP